MLPLRETVLRPTSGPHRQASLPSAPTSRLAVPPRDTRPLLVGLQDNDWSDGLTHLWVMSFVRNWIVEFNGYFPVYFYPVILGATVSSPLLGYVSVPCGPPTWFSVTLHPPPKR